MSTKQRISWETYALRIAHVASLRSEDPYKQVGACALDKDNRVIGVAYNGLGSGKEVELGFWQDRDVRRPYMVHAETNLLSLFRRNECALLACTMLPCSACAAAIVAHNIPRVIYMEEYARDNKALDIFRFYGIQCDKIALEV